MAREPCGSLGSVSLDGHRFDEHPVSESSFLARENVSTTLQELDISMGALDLASAQRCHYPGSRMEFFQSQTHSCDFRELLYRITSHVNYVRSLEAGEEDKSSGV